MDICKAIVQKVFPEGPHGPYAFATAEDRPDIVGSIAFSLERTVWDENDWPEGGSVVLLGKLRLKRAGWRAKEGRFWTPSDERTQQRARSTAMPFLTPDPTKSAEEQLISKDDFRRHCEAEGIDRAKVTALIPQWAESEPRTEGTKSALVGSDLVLRSNGTVVFLDGLMCVESKILAAKHMAGESNPHNLEWDEFVTSVTSRMVRSTMMVHEVMQTMGHSIDHDPPPYYMGDMGWSKDREERKDKLYRIMDDDQYADPPRHHAKETLAALRSLIEETEDAVRNNPKTQGGMTWLEQSKFVQGLLYTWYCATKKLV